MPPKGGNAKKESGRAKKADNEAAKKAAAAADAERKEADAWKDTNIKGGKAKKDEKEEKRKADLERKAVAARLLAEEEASAPAKVKPSTKKAPAKAVPKPAGPGAIASGGPQQWEKEEPESFSATGLDNALDLLDVVTAKMDKASVGTQAAGLERHPERRYKAAFEAYQERELPILRQDQPGLRLQQYKDLMHRNFKKSPENPFNQTTVSYDASKEDRVDALKQKKAEVEDRLRA